MLLHLSTWAEIEDQLARSKAVVVPIGSNEQHGPTGLLGTDWLCPEIISHEASKLSETFQLPASAGDPKKLVAELHVDIELGRDRQAVMRDARRQAERARTYPGSARAARRSGRCGLSHVPRRHR